VAQGTKEANLRIEKAPAGRGFSSDDREETQKGRSRKMMTVIYVGRIVANTRALIVPIVVGLICSCSNATSGSVAEINKVPEGDKWHVKLAVSGGFASVRRMIELDSSGLLLATDQKRKVSVSKQASYSLVAEVGQLIKKGMIHRPDRSQRGTTADCSDCFEYHLAIAAGNISRSLELGGFPTNTSADVKIIRLLAAQLEKELMSAEN